MKRSRVLEEIDADITYDQTRLAKRAPGARKRLAALLLAGAALCVIPLSVGWGMAAIALGAIAWAVWRGRLGGIVSAALAALVAVMLPLRLVFIGEFEWWALAPLVLGLATLYDIVLLIRDAELQNAFGLWAKRDE